MTPDQLRQIREARQKTRKELADELGCSAGAIVQWEGGTRSIPNWVEEKLFSSVKINLPLTDLHQLLDAARASGKDFTAILAQAIREYIAPKPATIQFPAGSGKQDVSALRVAEDPSGYTAPATAPATASGGSPASTSRTAADQAAEDFLAREDAAAQATSAPLPPAPHHRDVSQPILKTPKKHQ